MIFLLTPFLINVAKIADMFAMLRQKTILYFYYIFALQNIQKLFCLFEKTSMFLQTAAREGGGVEPR